MSNSGRVASIDMESKFNTRARASSFFFFVNKISVIPNSFTKITKIISLENFQLYSI